MSALSYGCQSCSTIDSFNGSLQGLHSSLGGNNNNMVNQMIEDNNFNNSVGNDLIIRNNTSNEIYNADLRQNNYGSNNYNNPPAVMNNPVNMNNTYGNGNNANQHPMNSNYNDVKIPQVVGTSARPAPSRAKVVPNNNNVVYQKESENEKKIGWFVKVGLIFLIAMSVHETIKYYINHSIKFNEGSPTYFVYYALGCLVAFYLVNNHVKFE